MKSRTPVPRDQRPPLPDFTPVERRYRHDGRTPERQKAFIEALADTGSVSRAAAMVNMTPEGAYCLRRQKGADSFRRAWEAALDYGVARMKDIAFERAIEGYLVPCFVGGRLIGWRRKYNDRLLMFCLRHYGEDASGKRTKIEYFSTKATAAGATASSSPERGGGPAQLVEGAHSQAEASTTVVRTISAGRGEAADLDHSTALTNGFDGVELDDRARAEILSVLEDCAARRRAVEGTADDPDELFLPAEQDEVPTLIYDPGYKHPRKEMRRPPPAGPGPLVQPDAFLEPAPRLLVQRDDQFRSGPQEMPWELLDDEREMTRIEEAVASLRAARSTESKANDGEADASA